MTEGEYRDHCDSDDGFCEVCGEVTRYGLTEPDAEGYDCPDCGGQTVYGMEQALLMGLIEIE